MLEPMKTEQPYANPQMCIVFPIGALSVSSTMFHASRPFQVVSAVASWGVASVSGTLNIEKLTGTTAPGSGTSVLTSDIDLAGTANTVTSGTLTGTVADLQLANGDRLGVKLGGVLTSLVGGLVTITLKQI